MDLSAVVGASYREHGVLGIERACCTARKLCLCDERGGLERREGVVACTVRACANSGTRFDVRLSEGGNCPPLRRTRYQDAATLVGKAIMALVKCAKCGKDMSRGETGCAACGAPARPKRTAKDWFFAGALLIVIAIGLPSFVQSFKSPTPSAPQATAPAPVAEPAQPKRSAFVLEDNAAIDKFLAPFTTKADRPLRVFLDEYGMRIYQVQVVPVEGFQFAKRPWDQPGDWYVSVDLKNKPGRKLPCGMEDEQKAGREAQAFLILRGELFLLEPGSATQLGGHG